MVTVICTVIVCITVLVAVQSVLNSFERIKRPPVQPQLSEEDLRKALQDTPDSPNFQDVINYINTEFTGVEESDEE